MNIVQPMTGPVTTTNFPIGKLITNVNFGTVFVGNVSGGGKIYLDANDESPNCGQQVFPSGSDIFVFQTNAKVIL